MRNYCRRHQIITFVVSVIAVGLGFMITGAVAAAATPAIGDDGASWRRGLVQGIKLGQDSIGSGDLATVTDIRAGLCGAGPGAAPAIA